MATIVTALNIQPNDGGSDNRLITPGGGDIYVQLSRGYACVINRFRVDILQPNGAGGWLPAKDPALAEGMIPSTGHEHDVMVRLGPPMDLKGRRTVLQSGGIALPPGTPGRVDSIMGIYQIQPDGVTYRRVEWDADSAHNVKELISRFEINIT